MAFSKAWAKGLFSGAKPVEDEDALLVTKVQEGDLHAFDLLVKKHRERLYSVIYNLTGNSEEAYDLCQEAFIKAFRSINKFNRKCAYYTWLYRIAVNTTLNYLKKERKRRFLSLNEITEETAPKEALESLSTQSDSEKGLILKEIKEKLNEGLQILSLKHRAVITMYEIEGMSHSEIAAVLGCSEGTVRSRLHYAKQQLKQFLQDYIS